MSHMDFEHVLTANTIDEWKDHYIHFDVLLKAIATKRQLNRGNLDELEVEAIWLQQVVDDKHNKKIKRLIEAESKKVNNFFLQIEQQLSVEYTLICESFNKLKSNNNNNNNNYFNKSDEYKSDSESENESEFEDSKYSVSEFLEPLHIPKPIATPLTLQSKAIYLQQMKGNIFHLYQRFIVLSNYSTINQMGFEIIMDTFNKTSDAEEMDINNLDFIESDKCNECMNELIDIYANIYEEGDIDRGKVHLFNSISWHNTKNKLLNKDRTMFTIGTKFGIMLGLIFWCVLELLSLIYLNINMNDMPQNVIHIYRSVGVLTVFLWFWSCCVYIWSNKRINFVFIFGLNPRNRLTFLQYFDAAITLTNIYVFNIILFIETFKQIGAYYSIIWPISLFIFDVLCLVIPIYSDTTFNNTRKHILHAIYLCFIAPFGSIGFREYMFADILTSFSKEFVDIYMSGCIMIFNEYYYVENNNICINSKFSQAIKPILICIPYWFRLMQCIKHYYITKDITEIFCGGKYAMAIIIKIIGSIFGMHMNSFWFILSLLLTIYLIFWDIKIDWNIFPWNKRTKLYPTWWYSAACINDCIFRFFWIFTLFPKITDWPQFNHSTHLLIISFSLFLVFIEIAEIFRRCIWVIFRMEKAHIGQKEEFKIYKYTPLFYENNTINTSYAQTYAISTILESKLKHKTSKFKSKFLLLLLVTIIVTAIMAFNDEKNKKYYAEISKETQIHVLFWSILCVFAILNITAYVIYYCWCKQGSGKKHTSLVELINSSMALSLSSIPGII